MKGRLSQHRQCTASRRGAKTPGLVQSMRPVASYRVQEKGQQCEYLGKGARGRLQVDMKNGQITLNLNAVSLQPNLPKLAPQLA